MAGTKPKNITRNYSTENFMKPNNNGREKVRIMSILRIQQKNTRNQKLMKSGQNTVKTETQSRLSPGNGLRISPILS